MNMKRIVPAAAAFTLMTVMATSAFADRIYTGNPSTVYRGEKCTVVHKDGRQEQGERVDVVVNGNTQNGCRIRSGMAAPSGSGTQTNQEAAPATKTKAK